MFLTLTNLTKVFAAPDGTRVPVIDIGSLALADGEQVALIGSSGSGKTTLLHLIAGILTPDSGQVVFDLGTEGCADLAQLGEARRDVFRGRHIGYIFQPHHLLAGFTAMENVLLGMSFTGRRHDPAWAKHLLTQVGLADRLHYRPEKLSVGQQQRVAVARALANRPRLVLADEPTGALDAKNAQQVLQLRRKEIAILRALGATRVRILSAICLEAALVALGGGLLGLVVGHLVSAAGSVYLERTIGQGINYLAVGAGGVGLSGGGGGRGVGGWLGART